MIKQNQTERIYEEIGSFNVRSGKQYNYNPTLTKDKFEIVITTEDFELGGLALMKIREMLQK